MWKCAAPSAGSARASGNAIGREKRAGRSWRVFLTHEVRPPRKQRARRNQENSASLRLGGGFIVALRTDQGPPVSAGGDFPPGFQPSPAETGGVTDSSRRSG